MKKEHKRHHSFKYPTKYNESAILLYLISLEVTNLMREIRAQSPDASKQLSPDAVFTPEQIEEARKHATGFVKRAIAALAKRQLTLNIAMLQLERAKTLRAEVEVGLGLAVQNPKLVDAKEMERLERTMLLLQEKEKTIFDAVASLKNLAESLNQLIAKHRFEWFQHREKYATQLVAELEQKAVLLSELEKNELRNITKTLDEVKQSLANHGIIKLKK